jgi:DNA-binding transcriptional ArsR family regulator
VIVARVIGTFRDQGGGSILQVCSLTWQPLGRNHPNAIEGRGDHRHAIPPLRHAELTGTMSLHMVSHMPKYVLLDRTFGALADPTRRSILQLVSTGPASISELARPFGIALPTVLEHVRILEETRLLTTEKVGRVRECTLGPERLDEARQWIETFRMWERRLDGLDRYVSARTGRRA